MHQVVVSDRIAMDLARSSMKEEGLTRLSRHERASGNVTSRTFHLVANMEGKRDLKPRISDSEGGHYKVEIKELLKTAHSSARTQVISLYTKQSTLKGATDKEVVQDAYENGVGAKWKYYGSILRKIEE